MTVRSRPQRRSKTTPMKPTTEQKCCAGERAKLEEATKHNYPPPGSIRLYEVTMRRFPTVPVLHKMYPTTYCDPNCDFC
ncbi:hypothetical protein HPB50_010643 [Hyalomma asiaticum]|uniref:Uncharacterized protein n=1 Tax=Hyalomma asiaticum TaxID=266040 RepID=A0ACB7T3S6_HYAAI|nr:hypothetical protein HPB50_010643 [Hyalomma asiaticum]